MAVQKMILSDLRKKTHNFMHAASTIVRQVRILSFFAYFKPQTKLDLLQLDDVYFSSLEQQGIHLILRGAYFSSSLIISGKIGQSNLHFLSDKSYTLEIDKLSRHEQMNVVNGQHVRNKAKVICKRLQLN